MSEPHEMIIDAFLDGEPVDAERLTEALGDAPACQYLADVLVLRGLVGSDPGADAVVAPARTTAASRRTWIAAAAVVVAAGSGFGLGWRAAGNRAALIAPPGSPAVAISVSAPEPTAVIRLESGVDWDERRW
ncbi:MAG TPA: hypothetical protein VMM93_10620 [Vicinamibacterales bacterium]|nr:hypothetical protein [Vicinamibacterales bacterium]